MLGGMQDWSLRVTHLIDHAARECGSREIATRWGDGTIERTSWAGVAHDAKRLAQALAALGLDKGDRVATLAMNHHRHLIAWYGAIGFGGVIHTLNVRLFDEQLVYIINHAEDRVLMYDAVFAPLVERLKPQLTTVEHYICFDTDFVPLLDAHDGDFAWATGDERDPCMLCYTSGTTGHPKGVLYEHRSTMLHAVAEIAPSVFDLSPQAVLLPIVPMFHAASWGLPFAGAAAGVPTVWLAMFQHLDALADSGRAADLGKLKIVTIGGSACPRAMIERLMRMGIRVNHAWGMTETSPIGTMGAPSAAWESLSFDQQVDETVRQGRVPFGVELRIVGEDGATLQRDGKASGNLQIRGPWVVKRYFKAEADAVDADQWFDTGDVAILHPDGTMQITDRSKDVIKSGGEWISSVELENAAIGCAGVQEAAAIGIAHPKWDERPVLIVVKKPGEDVTEADVKAWLADRIAKWWMPDRVLFVDELPHTGTGKIQKVALRAQFKDFVLEG